VRWLVVHWSRLSEPQRSEWRAAATLGVVFQVRSWESVRIYELPSTPGAGEWRSQLATLSPRETTLSGLSRSELDPAETSGTLKAQVRPKSWVRAGKRAAIHVRVELVNTGTSWWPGLDTDERGLVLLQASLLGSRGTVVVSAVEWLGDDLAPNTRLVTEAQYHFKAPPGSYRLRIELVQRGSRGDLRALPVVPFETTIEIADRGQPGTEASPTSPTRPASPTSHTSPMVQSGPSR
jgi:hypothetical protein